MIKYTGIKDNYSRRLLEADQRRSRIQKDLPNKSKFLGEMAVEMIYESHIAIANAILDVLERRCLKEEE